MVIKTQTTRTPSLTQSHVRDEKETVRKNCLASSWRREARISHRRYVFPALARRTEQNWDYSSSSILQSELYFLAWSSEQSGTLQTIFRQGLTIWAQREVSSTLFKSKNWKQVRPFECFIVWLWILIRLSQLVKACESLPLLFLPCQIHFLFSKVIFAYCFL